MRQTVIVSALTAVVTVVLSVVVLNQLGAGTVSSASVSDISVDSNLASSEDSDQIQGDTDCDGDVDAVDGLGVLVDVAALEALGQQEPCVDVGSVIPAGEGIPGPAGPAGPQGEQGPQGGQGAPGEQGSSGVSLFANVSLGTLGGGSALSASRSATGLYTVTFGQDVSACVPVVSLGTANGGSATSGVVGEANVSTNFPTGQVSLRFRHPATGDEEDTEFHLIVAC